MRSSPEAGLVATSGASRIVFFSHTLRPCRLLLVLSFICFLLCTRPALTQDVSPPAAAPNPTTQSESKQTSTEIATHDEPTTFKVNVKLVVVRAVVRDSQGHAVGNLHQEDFQIFDKGKPQVITHFDVEQPGAMAARARQKSEESSGASPSVETSSATGNAPAAPERFVAYLFDDVHLEFGDLARVREAAERHFATLKPTDRAAIYTTSGVTDLDFTDDHSKLHEALLRLQPRPILDQFSAQLPGDQLLPGGSDRRTSKIPTPYRLPSRNNCSAVLSSLLPTVPQRRSETPWGS